MLTEFERIFRTVANIGADGHSVRTARRMRVVNVAAAIGAGFVALGIVVDSIYGVPSLHPVTLWNLGFLCGYLAVFPVNRLGRPLFSATMLILVAWGNILLTTIYIGTPHGLHVFFISIAVLAVLMTRDGQEWIVAIAGIVSAILYGYSQIYLTQGRIHPFSDDMLKALMLSSTAGAICVAVLPPMYFRRLVGQAEDQLAAAHARTTRLLHAILPASVARRLEDDEHRVVADRFDNVTVMFADIVGFTPQAAVMPAPALVERLNGIFSAFDDLAGKYGLEKIKTIGDAYMVAGGVPEPLADHAVRVVGMACEMMVLANRMAAGDWPGLRLRIGIHSGAVVAGVIGRTKFAYDVWGSTVNIASRLEGICAPDEIVISDSTHRRLEGKFSCVSPRRVALRGQGEVDVWTVSCPEGG